jgi:hypothetical protein
MSSRKPCPSDVSGADWEFCASRCDADGSCRPLSGSTRCEGLPMPISRDPPSRAAPREFRRTQETEGLQDPHGSRHSGELAHPPGHPGRWEGAAAGSDARPGCPAGGWRPPSSTEAAPSGTRGGGPGARRLTSSCKAARSRGGLRPAASPLGDRAFLRLDRPLPAAGSRLRTVGGDGCCPTPSGGRRSHAGQGGPSPPKRLPPGLLSDDAAGRAPEAWSRPGSTAGTHPVATSAMPLLHRHTLLSPQWWAPFSIRPAWRIFGGEGVGTC